jgi:broad specificity phosphatase PhoE
MRISSCYLIRHATPDWTREDLPYHLPPGPPLVELGLRESNLLGYYLNRQGVRMLYTSPLERCLRTAQIAAQCSAAVVIIHDGLVEWQPGEAEQTVQKRIYSVFQAACQEGEEIGLVTHGGPIAMLLLALGMDIETLQTNRKYDRNNPAPPAGVWHATRNGLDNLWDLRLSFFPTFNDLSAVAEIS